MKRIFSIVLVIVFAIILVSCGDGEQFDFKKGYIVVGLEADYAPFNWLETTPNSYNMPLEDQEDAYVAGYDVEVAKFIGQELGLEVKFVQLEWEALIPALTSGKIDLIIAGMSPTEQRKRTIQFSNYYYISNHVVVLEENNAFASATSLNDLVGAKGIGQSGTVYEDIVNYLGDNYDVTVISGREDMAGVTTAILGGVADFTVVEKDVAENMIAENNNLIMILESTAEDNIYNVSDEDRELSIGLRKVEDRLLVEVNKALAKITEEMRTTWMDNAKSRS